MKQKCQILKFELYAIKNMRYHGFMSKKVAKLTLKKRPSAALILTLCVLAILAIGTLISAMEYQRLSYDTRSNAAPPVTPLYPVAQLPADNLIKNPWFSSPDCSSPALSPWVSVPNQPDHSWTASDKPSNPSPAGGCVTSARVSVGEDGKAATVRPNEDVKMYQIVAANPANTKLTFDMYWVMHTANYATVTVYGGNSGDPNGSWTKVWMPFSYSLSEYLIPPSGVDQSWIWKCYSEHYPECADAPQLPVSTTLATGYPYYKIEFATSLPPVTGGYKLTGVYLSASGSGNNPPAPSVSPAVSPKASPTLPPSASVKPPVPSINPGPVTSPRPSGDPSSDRSRRRRWIDWSKVRDRLGL